MNSEQRKHCRCHHGRRKPDILAPKLQPNLILLINQSDLRELNFTFEGVSLPLPPPLVALQFIIMVIDKGEPGSAAHQLLFISLPLPALLFVAFLAGQSRVLVWPL